jgi:hypothetical protein
VSHAERQLLEWIEERTNDGWRARVIEISVEINNSPCRLCTETLNIIRSLFPNLQRSSLVYTKWWDNQKIGTTKDSLAQIKSWTVSGPGFESAPPALVPQKVPRKGES